MAFQPGSDLGPTASPVHLENSVDEVVLTVPISLKPSIQATAPSSVERGFDRDLLRDGSAVDGDDARDWTNGDYRDAVLSFLPEDTGETSGSQTDSEPVRALSASITRSDDGLQDLSRTARERRTETEVIAHLEKHPGALDVLQELCRSSNERLARTEEALERIERLVASRCEQEGHVSREGRRDVRVDERLRRWRAAVADGTVRIDQRLRHSKAAIAKSTRLVIESRPRLPRLVSRHLKLNVPTTLVSSEARQAARRGVLVFAVLGMLAVGGFVLIRPTQESHRAQARDVALHAKPAEIPSPTTLTPTRGSGLLITPVSATIAGTAPAAPVAEQSPREAPVSKPAVSTAQRQFVGTLAVVSDPAGAEVFINRRPVGVTPLKLSSLRAGSHAVQIERDGYERWTAGVQVPADRVTGITAKLQPAGR